MKFIYTLILVPLCFSCSSWWGGEKKKSEGPPPGTPRPVTHETELSWRRSLDRRALIENYRDDFLHIRKRAHQGVLEAKYHLGVMYLRGIGTRRSREKAQKWLNEASVEGHTQATNVLIGMLQEAGYK